MLHVCTSWKLSGFEVIYSSLSTHVKIAQKHYSVTHKWIAKSQLHLNLARSTWKSVKNSWKGLCVNYTKWLNCANSQTEFDERLYFWSFYQTNLVYNWYFIQLYFGDVWVVMMWKTCRCIKIDIKELFQIYVDFHI